MVDTDTGDKNKPVEFNTDWHIDENVAVENLLAGIPLDAAQNTKIIDQAHTLIENIRNSKQSVGGMDRFLKEFGLTTTEGVALMCLSEALLRIPDAATADNLIKDKIGTAEWDKHLGKTGDLFVNASTWALMLTGKVIGNPIKTLAGQKTSGMLSDMAARLGEPVIRKAMLRAMKVMGQKFVMGRSIKEALKKAPPIEKKGYRHSFDMLGEGARTRQDAKRYFQNYADAIDEIGQLYKGRNVIDSSGISVKLSALHPRYDYAQKEKCVPEIADMLLTLAQKCAEYDIAMTVDAEEANRLDISLDIFERVLSSQTLGAWQGLGIAIQAYQKRCPTVIDRLAAMVDQHKRRIHVRLVKGAYWDSEIKYAQVMGLPGYPVFTRKNATDVSYLACAAKLLGLRDKFYVMFGTHNAHTLCSILEMAGENQKGFEFQQLYGIADALYDQITGTGDGKYICRIYTPVGHHEDLLPYLVRRLLENGANTGFMHGLQDNSVPIEELLCNPIDYMSKLSSKPHPKIPLPENIYATRRNSRGIEFANTTESRPLIKDIHGFKSKSWIAAPLIDGVLSEGEKRPVLNPANLDSTVGHVIDASADDMSSAIDTTHAAFPSWKNTPAEERAACLDRLADLMEENKAELMALCVREAGKCLPDARDELREAIDFCRYYAQEGRKLFGAPQNLPGPTGEKNTLSLEGRGVFLCISPWNFPLAIFTGQVTAALMAGNTVIAKPAGQTCLIAARAVAFMHEAGIPKDALALLPASGRMIGEQLVPDARIAGVCFTGSTQTAQTINRALAARDDMIVPLIAETGGQNAMIAGSSALPEQVVDDIIASAFQSAGQRCSALRVLYVHEGIADKILTMLEGACNELVVGDPARLSTDIGPVIDWGAKDALDAHVTHLDRDPLFQVNIPDSCTNGTFFGPRAYEISSIDTLEKEVFGPILHIIRYKAGTLQDVIKEVNKTGFGLTFGMHSRVDHLVHETVKKVYAGNCYVNRSIIGAVVGTQPFGGMGLSGTGPKAGGPHYLTRFAHERTLTVNTTASGGNATLVSLTESE